VKSVCQGADASFQKFDIILNYNQSVIDHLAVSLSARAQSSFNAPLLRSAQIGIANTTGLSAFDAGTIVGDQGYVIRGELQSPWSLPVQTPIFGKIVSVGVAPYLLGAYGEVFLQDPTALEAAAIHATSYGAGLRFGGGALGTVSNGSLSRPRHPQRCRRRRSRPLHCCRGISVLEHDPEKWAPVFPRDKREAFARRSCSNKKIERDDDSKKSHPALEENRRTRTRRSRASPVIWPKKS
jgi:hypothetical protein